MCRPCAVAGVDDDVDIDVECPMTPPMAGQPGACGSEGGMILEGLILRNQLLVLLQRRHFCDASGHLVGREKDDKYEFELDVSMARPGSADSSAYK